MKITYKGGDELAGGPNPSPNPQPEPNPQPNPNPNPPTQPQPQPQPDVPANTDGTQKTKIDVFVTLAFDPEKKECFTIEPPGGRSTTSTLHRWSYPGFTSIASLQAVAPRFPGSAIDTKAERLYVAFTTTGTSILGDRTDRVSAVGSIAVYDLKAIPRGQNHRRQASRRKTAR